MIYSLDQIKDYSVTWREQQMTNNQYLAGSLLKIGSLASPVLITEYSDCQLWLHISIKRISKKNTRGQALSHINYIKIAGTVRDNTLKKKKKIDVTCWNNLRSKEKRRP